MKKFWLISIFCLFAVNATAAERFIIRVATPLQVNQLTQGGSAAQKVRTELTQALSPTFIDTLSDIASNLSETDAVQVKELSSLSIGAHVILLERNLNAEKTQEFIKQIAQLPNVVFISEDRKLQIQSSKVKQINPLQWDMAEAATVIPPYPLGGMWGGDNMVNAWEELAQHALAPGEDVVVAVIDTGYTPNSNILSALQPLNRRKDEGDEHKTEYGYQMISDCRISGQCAASTPSWLASKLKYQANALDLGDFLTEEAILESNGFFEGCAVEDSTWHGTHVTGTIVANGYSIDKPKAVTGGAYAAKLVPVRVLGKCGGYDSDVIEGMLWAAGIDIRDSHPEVLPNKHPAQVLSMSLGEASPCSEVPALQEAINLINEQGAVIVVAAGNSSLDISGFNPAGCEGVISVAAKGPSNQLTYYSNFGATTIAASGGDRTIADCPAGDPTCPSSVYSTVWSSLQAFAPRIQGGKDAWITYQGTSMSTPHVAAAVANIIAVLKAQGQDGKYTRDEIIKILQRTAAPYNNCNYANGNNYCTDNDYALDTAAAIKYVLKHHHHPRP
jgi:serine protease